MINIIRFYINSRRLMQITDSLVKYNLGEIYFQFNTPEQRMDFVLNSNGFQNKKEFNKVCLSLKNDKRLDFISKEKTPDLNIIIKNIETFLNTKYNNYVYETIKSNTEIKEQLGLDINSENGISLFELNHFPLKKTLEVMKLINKNDLLKLSYNSEHKQKLFNKKINDDWNNILTESYGEGFLNNFTNEKPFFIENRRQTLALTQTKNLSNLYDHLKLNGFNVTLINELTVTHSRDILKELEIRLTNIDIFANNIANKKPLSFTSNDWRYILIDNIKLYNNEDEEIEMLQSINKIAAFSRGSNINFVLNFDIAKLAKNYINSNEHYQSILANSLNKHSTNVKFYFMGKM